jgi:hypothetical protein
MSSPQTRRTFLGNAARIGALAGLGDFAFLHNLPRLTADEVRGTANVVRFSADIEPLVRMLEQTDRERLLEVAAERVRAGTTYQELLAAVLLAGVRSIRPRPVGFQFHAVLVTNSAHLAALAAHDRDRWLPLFWALDNFKVSQATHLRNTDWVMPAVDEARVPPAAHARRRFSEAMDNWDEAGADAAVASLVRGAGASEVIELFWRYGARDFRDIGHKAIYAANAWRTLQTIGWRHAEPVMRSLAFALLEHEGGNPARRDADADRPWRQNLERVTRIRRDWRRGRADSEAAVEILRTLRTASPAEGCDCVVALLNRGIDPACLWDGVFLTAGEYLMRRPGIVGLHCVTSVNALHFAYQTSENDETRQLMLLQAAAFLPMFRRALDGRGRVVNDVFIDRLEPLAPENNGPAGIEEIYTDVSRDRVQAARKTLALLRVEPPQTAQALMAAGRRLIFTKGDNSHDYKFSSAALEDFYHVSPTWRTRFLATSMFNLRGAGDRDNALIRRTRVALGNG